jgi:hypothetical protein
MDTVPELIHIEARGNKLKEFGVYAAPKLQRLYLVQHSHKDTERD